MFDYIIVGAGTAGCVLANRLSESDRTRVLLLEAGPPDTKLEIRVPAAFSKLFKTAVDWAYETEPQPALANRRLFWPRGKLLGGSSSINAQMHVRGNRADFSRFTAPDAPVQLPGAPFLASAVLATACFIVYWAATKDTLEYAGARSAGGLNADTSARDAYSAG
jgi:choline dehydrogenase-like flavoprotein